MISWRIIEGSRSEFCQMYSDFYTLKKKKQITDITLPFEFLQFFVFINFSSALQPFSFIPIKIFPELPPRLPPSSTTRDIDSKINETRLSEIMNGFCKLFCETTRFFFRISKNVEYSFNKINEISNLINPSYVFRCFSIMSQMFVMKLQFYAVKIKFGNRTNHRKLRYEASFYFLFLENEQNCYD